MKFWIFALMTLFVACSTYNGESPSRARGIGSEAALKIAKAEIARRHIVLPVGSTIKVVEDQILLEFMPEVPIYAVSFYAPDPNRPVPLYRVFVHRETGKIYSFIDTHRIIRGDR